MERPRRDPWIDAHFYWVRLDKGGDWEPAQWSECRWFVIGQPRSFDTADLFEVGPELFAPNDGSGLSADLSASAAQTALGCVGSHGDGGCES